MDGINLELPNDTFRYGLQQHKTKQEILHPLQESLEVEKKNEIKKKYFALSHVYGSAMPMKLELERRLVQQPLRLPGLVSSNIASETLNTDVDFDFEDILNGKFLIFNF